MVEVQPPDFLGANCYTFQDFRQTFGGVVCGEGVTESGDLLVTAVGGASVNVNVAEGSAWVAGDLNGSSGMYYVTNDAQVTVTIAANGAGSSRVDLIVASVYDSQYIGAADSWAIEVVQGVAGGGTPAVPTSTRSGYLILGAVTVPASGGTPSVVSDLAAPMQTCGQHPYVDLRASASTSLPHNTATTITLATTTHNDSVFYTVASSVVTITQDGLYDISGFSSSNDSTVAATIEFSFGKNGTSPGGLPTGGGNSLLDWAGSISTEGYFLAAGTTIRLMGYQFQSSGTATITTRHDANFISRLFIRKMD